MEFRETYRSDQTSSARREGQLQERTPSEGEQGITDWGNSDINQRFANWHARLGTGLNRPRNQEALDEVRQQTEQNEQNEQERMKNILDGIDVKTFREATCNISIFESKKGSKELMNDIKCLHPHIKEIKLYLSKPGYYRPNDAINSLEYIYQNYSTFQTTTQRRLRKAGIPHLGEAGSSGS